MSPLNLYKGLRFFIPSFTEIKELMPNNFTHDSKLVEAHWNLLYTDGFSEI